ncbi:ankyrin repeat domain-containing protein [Rickettsiales bacterium]|nr:ankyrin repeat domain-containing protein [Rickettsiales bacterium]
MQIRKILIIITSLYLNNAIAQDGPPKINCLDIIYSNIKQSIECFEESDNKYSNIFQSYIYFFDLIKIEDKNKKITDLIEDYISANDIFLSNWLDANYSIKIMLQNEYNFLKGMSLLAIDLPISFIEKHKITLLNSYKSHFNDKRDKFLGNIIYNEVKLPQLHKLNNFLKQINSSKSNKNISSYRNENLERIKLLFLPDNKYKFQKDQIDNYLTFWSSFGLWNLKKYNQIQRQIRLSINELSRYYNKKLNIAQNKSYKISKISLNNYLTNYLPISNNIWAKYYNDPLFIAILNNKNNLLPLITKYTEKHKKERDKIALITFLNAAIIRDYDLNSISSIINNIRIDNLNNKGDFAYISAPLFVAINNANILEFLLKDWLFNPNQRNSFGKTPIFRAIQENNLESTKILIKYGAHIDLNTYIFASKKASYIALSTYQRTALIYAAWQGDLRMIKFLVENGADIYQKDSKGKYAIDYLEKNRFMNQSDKEIARKILQLNND